MRDRYREECHANDSQFFIIRLLIGALTACGPASAAPTATQRPTERQTERPTATATYTPSPTVMNTPIPPIVLSNFDVQLEGIGEHGNMACITYLDDQITRQTKLDYCCLAIVSAVVAAQLNLCQQVFLF